METFFDVAVYAGRVAFYSCALGGALATLLIYTYVIRCLAKHVCECKKDDLQD